MTRLKSLNIQQFFEFASNHPAYVGGAVLMVLLVAGYELRASRSSFASIASSEAVRLMNQGALLIDVRRREDFEAGHIAGARSVPGDTIADGARSIERFKDKAVIAYCDSGVTAAAAARQLTRLGFKHALNLRGGLAGWRQDNLPVVKG